MSQTGRRVLSPLERRKIESPVKKAGFDAQHDCFSLNAAAKTIGDSRIALLRALKAKQQNRAVGKRSRTKKLTEEHEKQLCEVITQLYQPKDCFTTQPA